MHTIITDNTNKAIEIFSTNKFGGINFFGLIMVMLILVPNIVYALVFRDVANKCTNKVMNTIEQIGRYASMALMVFCFGLTSLGFNSVMDLQIYLFMNSVLILLYWIVWVFYFKKQMLWNSMTLAILPILIFLVSGIMLSHVALILAALIFCIGHIYVTYQNAVIKSPKS